MAFAKDNHPLELDKVVYGRPPLYNKTADPTGRAVAKMLYEQPSIITITPGRINFSEVEKFLESPIAKEVLGKNLIDSMKNGTDSTSRLEFLKAYANAGIDNETAKRIQRSITDSRDNSYDISRLAAAAKNIITIVS